MEQISFQELMEDNLFEAWVNKTPLVIPAKWRLFVKQDGKWKKTEVQKYKKGLKLIKRLATDAEDLALNCPSKLFKPPVLRDKEGNKSYWRRFPIDHHWCGYCRRPTRFTTFKRHHFLGTVPNYEPRCMICGCRLVFLGKSAIKGLIT